MNILAEAQMKMSDIISEILIHAALLRRLPLQSVKIYVMDK